MSRSGRTPKRKISPDAVYNSVLVQRFINKMIQRGKKSISERILYGALDEIKKKLNKEPLEIFEKAIVNASPVVEVKARRVGGATYQVPIEVPRERSQSMAMFWIRKAASDRAGRTMAEKLAAELIDAFNHTGAAMKNRENLHKTAEANKAFSHFRW